jgi:hypothetical protein
MQLITFAFLAMVLSSCHHIDFNSDKWKNWKENSEEEVSVRWDMTEDLINNYDLQGKDTLEIFKLMGKERLDYFSNNIFIARYPLGYCRKGISYGTLELTFKNGKVVNIIKHCN